MRLVLARHGETLENKKGILQGWREGGLSSKGKKQALLLARRLKGTKIDFIYTSDLKRALETAKIISKHNGSIRVIADKRLREKKYGKLEGTKVSEERIDEVDWGDYTKENKKANIEKNEDFFYRVKGFYTSLIKKHPTKTILIIGHSGSILMLQLAMQGITAKGLKTCKGKIKEQSFTGLSEFQITKNGHYKPICINCSKHLKS